MPELFPAWFADWASSVTLLEVLIYVLAIVAIVKWGKRWWHAVVGVATGVLAVAKTLDSIHGLTAFMANTTATLAAQDDLIAEIHHESMYNNETSMKDAVVRTELGVKAAVEVAAANTESLAAIRAEIAALNPLEKS